MKHLFVIGVSGACLIVFPDAQDNHLEVLGYRHLSSATNGGKSTLCHRLSEHFTNTTCLCMDDYFWHSESANHVIIQDIDHANWEVTSAVHFERMVSDIEAWKAKAELDPSRQISLLFIEGIIIFNYKPLLPYLSQKFFITMPKDVCCERRRVRAYDPPDPPGYFEQVGWPMYLKNKDELKDQTDIVYLDGTEDQEKTLEVVLAHMQQMIKDNS